MIIFNALQTGLNGGIGRYSYELSKQLYSDSSLDIKLVVREQELEKFNFAKKEDLIIVKNIYNSRDRNIYEQFKLPKLIYKKYPDAIVHYPDSMAPLLSKNKVIITVHDLAFKAMNNIFTWKSKLWKNFVTAISIRKAYKIIAISDYTKKEIVRYFGNEYERKTEVIYNGFNDFSKEEINLGNVRKDLLDLKDKYILTVSTISPRKNIDGLIRVYNSSDCKNDYKLVIAGAYGWLYEDIIKLVDELGLKNNVIFTGKINDDELKYLYKQCSLFAYLSFYEGFGLPPLEAMSYGKICVVSNASSLPEVVGDAAIKVDPYNINEIRLSIENGLKASIIDTEKIIANTKRFSWEKCAEKTGCVYKMR